MDKKTILEMVHMMLESVNIDDGIVINNIRAMSIYRQLAPTNYSLMLADISNLVLKSTEDTPVLEPSLSPEILNTIACEPVEATILTDVVLLLEAILNSNIVEAVKYIGELADYSSSRKAQFRHYVRNLEKYIDGEYNLCHAKLTKTK